MLNVWTHMIGSLFFIWQLVSTSNQINFLHDNYSRPLLVFLVTCILYLLMSAMAHAFSSMSSRIRHMCFFIDYAGLSVYSFGAAIAYRAYSFPLSLRSGQYSEVFIPIAMINSLVCILFICESRFMEHHKLCHVFRVIAVALPCVWDNVPLIYRFCTSNFFSGSHCDQTQIPSGPWCDQFQTTHWEVFIALSASLFYASHVPERFLPKKFDIVGHSHQIFHILGMIGSFVQLHNIRADFDQLRHLGLLHTDADIFNKAYVDALMVVVIVLSVVVIATCRIWRHDEDTLDNLQLDSGLCHLRPNAEALFRKLQRVIEIKCHVVKKNINMAMTMAKMHQE